MSARPVHDSRVSDRWLPHPVLSILLIVLWLSLVQRYDPGSLLMATFLAVAIPRWTRNIWNKAPRFRSLGLSLAYLGLVTWDVIVANMQVAMLILFRAPRELRSQWLVVPLELKSQEAIAVLAGTITLTPGTVSCDLSADGRSLLVHCLDTEDPVAEVAKIKKRYEDRLSRIFAA